jgi:cell wall-associated NlpC family hydrolase
VSISEIAQSWVGTPFFPKMALKGVGADCVSQALAIYQEAALLPSGIQLPDYNLAGGDHLNESTVLAWLNTSGFFVPCDTLAAGRLPVFRIGKVVHHVGVAVDSLQFVHNIRGYGSILSRIDDSTWSKRLEAIFRLKGQP